MFNSHSLLHSGSHCALIKAELRKKTGVRKYQVLLGAQVNQPPPRINVARQDYGILFNTSIKTRAGSLQFWAGSVPEPTEVPRERSAGVTKADKGAPQLQCSTDT